ncbi:MAG: hypothetical protein ACTSX0_02205 [Promethearchaeota archaeon]
MKVQTANEKFLAIKSLLRKYSVGSVENSFIHRLAKEIDEIIDEGKIAYQFCPICLLEISDAEAIQIDNRFYHKYCLSIINKK